MQEFSLLSYAGYVPHRYLRKMNPSLRIYVFTKSFYEIVPALEKKLDSYSLVNYTLLN